MQKQILWMEGMMKNLMLAMVGALLFSSSAYAAGYGSAGCGLGSIIFGESTGIVQVSAATTNGTSYTQPFGITSGTSNCDSSGIVLAEKEQEIFVEHNFSSLSKEMANGKGEHLETLAGLLGCPLNVRGEFASMTQQQYEAIFIGSPVSSAEMLNSVKEKIASDPKLSGACK